ncbi:ABC transporter permease [Kitasatospora cinereorecta]|uniref:ABC transporter permease n=1 Tax=Kitasatospora cinereorecta TaxID=285560 RepID=UPI0031F78E34
MRLILEALRDLRAHRGRTLLSAVSLFVAVIAVVGVSTVGSVVQDVFVANAEQQHGRAVTVATRLPHPVVARGLPAVLTALDTNITRAGGSYLLMYQDNAQVGAEGGAQPQVVTLYSGTPGAVRRLPVLHGGWPAPDPQTYPGGLVLNQAAEAQYGGVGTKLSVQLGRAFPAYTQPVVGVIADGVDAPVVYQSLLGALTLQPGVLPADWSPELHVHADGAGESVLRSAVLAAAADLGAPPTGLDVRRADTVGSLLASLRSTRSGFLAVAALTLLVAVVGLLNIGFATVRDRTRELTLRRATGATRGHVFLLVLLASVLVGLLTALAAVLLALGAVDLVVPHLLARGSAVRAPAFPAEAALVGLAAALAAALAGGAAPALAAARVDMAQALRD